MEKVEITKLQRRLLECFDSYSVFGDEKPDHLCGQKTISQDFHFDKALQALKYFYKSNGGEKWSALIHNNQ